MNMKRMWLSSVVVFVVMAFVGWAINVATSSMYHSTANLWRLSTEQAHFLPWIYFSIALFSIFFCLIFAKGFGSTGVSGGISFGFFVGLMMSSTAFSLYAYMPIPLDLTYLWVFSSILETVIAGLVVGLIYKP